MMIVSLCTLLYGDRLVHFDLPIQALNFSTDGKFLVVGLANGNVSVIDVESCQTVHTCQINKAPITAIARVDDHLVIGYANGMLTIKSMELEACSTFEAHQGAVTFIKCSSTWIVTASHDNTVRIWDNGGNKLASMKMPSAASAIEVVLEGNQVYIGCKNGTVHRFDGHSQSCDELVADLHKGEVTCLTLDTDGLFVGFGNGEVVFFNFLDKSTKTYRSYARIDALHVIKSKKIIFGISRMTMSDYTWDSDTGYLFGVHEHQTESPGSIASNGLILAIGCPGYVALHPFSYEIKNIPLLTLIGGLIFDSLKIFDKKGGLCGFAQYCLTKKYYNMRACLSESSSLQGGTAKVTLGSHKVIIFDYKIATSDIKQLMLYRTLGRGDLAMGYNSSVNINPKIKIYTMLPWITNVRPFIRPSRIQVHFYSCNVPIKAAYIEYENDVHETRCIKGINPIWPDRSAADDQVSKGGRQDSILFFEAFDCCGPYTLSILSEKNLYQWQLQYLSEQSDLLLRKDQDGLLQLRHWIEYTDQFVKLPRAHVCDSQ